MNMSDVQDIAGGGISDVQDMAGLAVAGYRRTSSGRISQTVAVYSRNSRKMHEIAGTVVIKTAKDLQILGI